jgi:hypothetical protein
MIKTRIQRWKLDKKHKWHEMRTAVQMLADNRATGSRKSCHFKIRGQVVTYSEVLRYFRRKGIQDPIHWVESLLDDGFSASPDVTLLTPSSSLSGSDSELTGAEEPELTISNEGRSKKSTKLPNTEPHHSNEFCLCLMEKHAQTLPTTNLLLHPAHHLLSDKIMWHMRDYCAAYVESLSAAQHKEPVIHQYTIHGLFGQRMQDGANFLLLGQNSRAFDSFQSAFGMVRDLLRDNHPMSLAQMMANVCELSLYQMTPLIKQLVTYIREMAVIDLKQSHPITAIFFALAHAESELSELVLSMMRGAICHLSNYAGRLNWKTLYLKERFCDCLYYAKVDGERACMRLSLFKDQEVVYGRSARNVLFTLTNVADDCLQQGRPDEAEKAFRDALQRSEALGGYGRAKIRFAALEGLAKTALMRATLASDVSLLSDIMSESNPEATTRHSRLREAVRLLAEAEGEAGTWFEVSSRRTLRVRSKKTEILELLAEANAYSQAGTSDLGSDSPSARF